MQKLAYDGLIKQNLGQITELQQWLGFRHMKTYGRLSKPPVDVFGKVATATDKGVLKRFESMVWPFQQGITDGFTFVMQGTNYMVIDMDDYVIDGEILPRAQRLIDSIDSYAEVSVSGTGVHILVECERKPTDGKFVYKKLDIELIGNWCGITGNVITNSNKIAVISEEKLTKLINWLEELNAKKPVKQVSNVTYFQQQSDQMVLSKFMAKCPFAGLYTGQHDLGDDSHAADKMDYSLAKNLLYWTNKNVQQTVRLMWGSALVRDKWLRMPNYVENTVQSALG